MFIRNVYIFSIIFAVVFLSEKIHKPRWILVLENPAEICHMCNDGRSGVMWSGCSVVSAEAAAITQEFNSTLR